MVFYLLSAYVNMNANYFGTKQFNYTNELSRCLVVFLITRFISK